MWRKQRGGESGADVALDVQPQGKIIMKTTTILVTFLLAACAPGAPIEEARDVQSSSGAPADAASCHAAGGVMKPVGRRQTLQCVLSYADAGKSCTSGSQCAGDCRAEPGTEAVPGQPVAGYCQATSDRFGCSTQVEDGRAQSTICID